MHVVIIISFYLFLRRCALFAPKYKMIITLVVTECPKEADDKLQMRQKDKNINYY